jgi:hypothetical protein
VSIKQRIFESKNTYYDRLDRCWHEGEQDIWRDDLMLHHRYAPSR